MISTLKLEKFKGITREYKFRKGNLIQGANFTGKSAIDQAVRCLILGYMPDMAKTSAAIKKFASGYPMGISANLSLEPMQPTVGVGIRFEKVKSAIKQTQDFTYKDMVGFDERTAVLFDPTVFFGLPDSARITKACALVIGKSGSINDLSSSVTDLLESIPKEALKRWVSEAKETDTLNELVAYSETFWKTERKSINADIDRMKKMIEGLADMNAVDAEIAALPSVEELQAKKEEVAKKIEAIRIEDARKKGELEQRQASDLKRTELQESADKIPETETEIKVLKRSIDDLNQKIEAMGPAIEEAMAAVKEATSELTEWQEKLVSPAVRVRTDPIMDNAQEDQIYAANVKLQITEGILEIAEVVSWVDSISDDDFEKYQSTECNLKDHRASLYDEYIRLCDERKNLSADMNKLSQDFSGTNRALAEQQAAKSALESLADFSEAGFSDEGAKDRAAELKNLSEELIEVTNKVGQANALAQDKARIESGMKLRDDLESRYQLAGKILDFLKQKKSEVVSVSMDAPLQIANKLADGILKGKLVFQEGEIGMLVDDSFISQRVFSGTETAITMAGLAAGLAAKNPLRLLMIDEIGRLDVPNAKKLITNLIGMVKDGDIDQWIAIGPTNPELKAISSDTDYYKLIEVEAA